MTKTVIELKQGVSQLLFGNLDQNISTIQQLTGCAIKASSQGVELSVDKSLDNGTDFGIELAADLVQQLAQLISYNIDIDRTRIVQVWDFVKSGKTCQIESIVSTVVAQTPKGKKITPKTLGQSIYVDALKNNTLVFGIGPAGTGKTYLAVATAITALKKREVGKIILTRPAIEAGEKLGFLPGDLQQKVDPYLRPLYDALEEMTGEDSYIKLIERGLLEIAPLAYMRGRTLNNAFIILDEAQNTTHEQMKMFLTRFGQNSKVVVTGDLTQIDLPKGQASGLATAIKILDGIPDISIVHLQAQDIVRHALVQKIVQAYSEMQMNDKV